jgi:heme exporter protein CcmD
MAFIVGAYVAALGIVGVLTAWIMIDYHAQRRRLADLEMRGLTRRSAATRAEQAMQQAKEEA